MLFNIWAVLQITSKTITSTFWDQKPKKSRLEISFVLMWSGFRENAVEIEEYYGCCLEYKTIFSVEYGSEYVILETQSTK